MTVFGRFIPVMFIVWVFVGIGAAILEAISKFMLRRRPVDQSETSSSASDGTP